MGGRGSASNVPRYTQKQKAMIDRLKKMADKYGYEDVKVKTDKSGAVSYEYTERKTVTKVHGGKMQSADKNDIYERLTKQSGKIMPDGLRKKNKTEVTDKLIKKGKR